MPTKNGSKKNQTVADVMTPDPIALLETETLQAAGKAMCENDIGDVIVLDDTGGRLKGIITDRDIVVRAVADGEDPTRTTLSSVCTATKLCTVSPTDSVDTAVKLMADNAIRRLPVVENEKPVGIVSIGDLAQVLDKRSALAEISSAPAND